VPVGRAARVELGIADEKFGERVRASGLGRHGNPPFTASNPAGDKPLPPFTGGLL
jgi:hypothetical protein